MKKAYLFLVGVFASAVLIKVTRGKDPINIVENLPDFVSGVVSEIDNVAQNTVAPLKLVFGTKYDALIKSSAEQYGIDPEILYRLLYEESRFRDDIITGKKRSSVGALGIAQFMPATAVEQLGSVEAALDPAQAIPGAARYLSRLIAYTGSLQGGVAAYNWGMGNVKNKGLSRAPAETRNYVLAITGVSIA